MLNCIQRLCHWVLFTNLICLLVRHPLYMLYFTHYTDNPVVLNTLKISDVVLLFSFGMIKVLNNWKNYLSVVFKISVQLVINLWCICSTFVWLFSNSYILRHFWISLVYPQNSLERIFSLLSHTKGTDFAVFLFYQSFYFIIYHSVTCQSQDCMGQGTGYAIKWWADGVRSSTCCLGLLDHLKLISFSQSQDSLNYIRKWKTNAIHVMTLLAILVICSFLCLNLHGFCRSFLNIMTNVLGVALHTLPADHYIWDP